MKAGSGREKQLDALVERVRTLDDTTIDGFVSSSAALMDSLEQVRTGEAAAPLAAPATSSSVAIATGDSMARTKVGPLLAEGTAAIGRTVLLKGWVRTVRDLKNFSFVELNDGSSLAGMQVSLYACACACTRARMSLLSCRPAAAVTDSFCHPHTHTSVILPTVVPHRF